MTTKLVRAAAARGWAVVESASGQTTHGAAEAGCQPGSGLLASQSRSARERGRVSRRDGSGIRLVAPL
eukprot:4416930-Pyramimonas_sp.AAC.1